MKVVRGRSSDWSVLKPMFRTLYATESAERRSAISTVTRGRRQQRRTMPRKARPSCDISDNGEGSLFFARDEALEPDAGHVVGPLLGR